MAIIPALNSITDSRKYVEITVTFFNLTVVVYALQ